ncbi:unnamed protein product [Phaedon cochleariae]|uniref:C2H2-type domain-containing protein n=1 Tax=Phaedon cochleariae TaxID=80249 RepID=A0A9P0DG11_PHACE|nr:unnamed protein product [Phaedon cochleariae]
MRFLLRWTAPLVEKLFPMQKPCGCMKGIHFPPEQLPCELCSRTFECEAVLADHVMMHSTDGELEVACNSGEDGNNIFV